jgi:hypothetical protein
MNAGQNGPARGDRLKNAGLLFAVDPLAPFVALLSLNRQRRDRARFETF